MGTWPATQACARTGNRTGNPWVHRWTHNPLSHSSPSRYYYHPHFTDGEVKVWSSKNGTVRTWTQIIEFQNLCLNTVASYHPFAVLSPLSFPLPKRRFPKSTCFCRKPKISIYCLGRNTFHPSDVCLSSLCFPHAESIWGMLVYVYTCFCAWVYTCMCMQGCTFASMCISECIHVGTCGCTLCVYVCAGVCTCVHV